MYVYIYITCIILHTKNCLRASYTDRTHLTMKTGPNQCRYKGQWDRQARKNVDLKTAHDQSVKYVWTKQEVRRVKSGRAGRKVCCFS